MDEVLDEAVEAGDGDPAEGGGGAGGRGLGVSPGESLQPGGGDGSVLFVRTAHQDLGSQADVDGDFGFLHQGIDSLLLQLTVQETISDLLKPWLDESDCCCALYWIFQNWTLF